MMETMEYRYHDALAAADSMSDKARVSIELLDSMLSDVEMRAHKLRQRGLQNMTDAAEIVIGEGRHVLDKGLDKARGVVEEGLRGAKHAAESLEDKIQKAMLRAKEHGLISYEDLPVPWRVNPHIVRGYRFTETYSGCIRSAFGVSNELVNIWSHAIGLVLVLAIAFYFYPTSINFHLSTNADVLIAAMFFFAACQCLMCSTIWHTMNAITDVNLISMFACVDYTGISLLIAASIMTTEYTAFYCEPVSRWIYMVVTGLLGVGGVILPWNPTFNRADMAWARVAFFVFLGATGFMVSRFRSLGDTEAGVFCPHLMRLLALLLTVYGNKLLTSLVAHSATIDVPRYRVRLRVLLTHRQEHLGVRRRCFRVREQGARKVVPGHVRLFWRITQPLALRGLGWDPVPLHCHARILCTGFRARRGRLPRVLMLINDGLNYCMILGMAKVWGILK